MQQRNSLATGFAARSCQPSTASSPIPKLLKLGLTSLFVAAALVRGGPARADIWGYVDATGRAHMASEKLDERYQLFFKGTKKVGGPASVAPTAAPVAPTVAGIDAATAESFRQSERFIRTSTQSNVKRFEPMIEKTAKANRIDPALVKAVVAVESSFQPDAVSPKGARGLMQVIPDTAERYGVVGDKRKSAGQKLLDPATNLRVGIAHLSNLMSMFAANLELALAAYNAGEGAVLKYAKKIPPYPETQEYVKLVKQFYAGFLPPAKAQPASTMMLAANTATPAAATTAGSGASDALLSATGASAKAAAAAAASAAASSAAAAAEATVASGAAATAATVPVAAGGSTAPAATTVTATGTASPVSGAEQPKANSESTGQAANG